MPKEAFVFPGQGSQKVGMGENLINHTDPELAIIAERTFEEANDALGERFDRICLTNPDGKLDDTTYTQPALLIVSTAAYRILNHQGRIPDVVAGHSLGEYSALVAAEAISFQLALKLVRARGRSMRDAMTSEGIIDNPGKMAAILGLSLDDVREICNQVDPKLRAEIANINSEGQIVIAGRNTAIEYASGLVLDKRGKVRGLNVSIASHCSLMAPAQQEMSMLIEASNITTPRIPFIANVSGSYVENPQEIKRGLVDQMTGTVQWLDTMKLMIADGVDSIVEVGPGEVLSNLFKRTSKDVALHSTDILFPYLISA